MIKDNKIYFEYEGYIDRFGYSRRPALVRHSRKEVRGYHYNEIEIVTLFIDGKTIESILEDGDEQYRDDYAIVLLEPDYSKQRESPTNDMVARPFDANSKDDWYCLFYDTSEFNRMGDRLAYAIIAIALDKYYLSLPILKEALNILQEPAKTQVLDLIKYASYGLSINKIGQVNELCRFYGRPADSFYPEILVDTAKQYGISYSTCCVHSLVDELFEQAGSREIENPSTFTRFMQWLDDDTISISLQELNTCFAYLGEEKRSIAIRRYFLDVKNGVFNYDAQSLKAFSSQNYQYYSTQRYIFECWPRNRNVSTEFLLDCLKTYEQTNQERFHSANPPLTNVLTDSISQIVSACPGEIGVAVIVNNRDTVKVNNKSVYPMMSVFKVHQALALCNDFDNKGISLDTLVNINRDKLDPKTWSPMLKDYSGPVISLTVRDLLRYTLTQSDNNASNLMFKDMVNVAQTDSFIATLIPRSSFQIAYTEEEMSADHNKAYSNYTSPLGAAMLMNRLFTEGLIDDEKQSFIKNTLKECKTGVDRIAAPLLDKEGVVIAHKTGSGYVNENGVLAAHNDVAYICLPNNISYTLAVFVKDFKGNESQASQYVAHISAVVYSLLMQTSVKS